MMRFYPSSALTALVGRSRRQVARAIEAGDIVPDAELIRATQAPNALFAEDSVNRIRETLARLDQEEKCQ